MIVQTGAIELVLPSGAFARVRPVTWGDRAIASAAARGNPDLFCANIAARAVTLDEKNITVDQALELDVRDADALVAALGKIMSGPVKAEPPPKPPASPEGVNGV